jgi:hypothetical protein
LPGKYEHIYSFESHLEVLPYIFAIYYTLAFAISKNKETTTHLTEGITLLLSLAIIYWVIDHGFWNIDNWFIKCLVIISMIFSAFSILSSLANITLTKKIRLLLSIWSSIVLLLFAIEIFTEFIKIRILNRANIFLRGYILVCSFFF